MLGANCVMARHDPPGFAAASPQPLYPGWMGVAKMGPPKPFPASAPLAALSITVNGWPVREKSVPEKFQPPITRFGPRFLEDPADAVVPYVVN